MTIQDQKIERLANALSLNLDKYEAAVKRRKQQQAAEKAKQAAARARRNEGSIEALQAEHDAIPVNGSIENTLRRQDLKARIEAMKAGEVTSPPSERKQAAGFFDNLETAVKSYRGDQ